ncbi:response regulator [Zavarzinia compransoris]|uniref:response regulator n=1 Tax=Zavarzinia marina TaxID=2911065 RepID=UPI001F2EF489|nr:response regulator [Zavarzinia marina]MCF4167720.1 response regulator [Zavarzinia marina]
MAEPTVLVVDDEAPIRRTLRTILEAHGYHVFDAPSAADALRRVRTERPDLVLLDLGLPDRDGIEVLRELRAWSAVPVVILSARGDEAGKVKALDLGADDYVTKPFGTGELLARLRAALRHRAQSAPAPVFESEGLRIDAAARIATVNGRTVRLSRREWDVLRVLAMDAGRVLTHRQILHKVWGPAQEGQTQYLWVYIGHLRDKLEPDPSRPRFILTEPGIGYRLVRAEEDVSGR